MSTAPDSIGFDAVDGLLAHVLQRAAPERATALDELCAAHPSHAGELRARYGALLAVGLLDPQPHAAAAMPSRLGDFRLVEPLGGGGMGVVYRAVEEPLQREVALKLIRPEHLFFPGARQWFKREVETIASLQHPAIVPIYRVGEADAVPFFAMELVTGASLGDAVRRVRRLSQERLRVRDLATAVGVAAGAELAGVFACESWTDACVTTALQVAQALAHAHARGVVHRDVKPSNVMLTPDGRVRLLDFGLASRAGAVKLTRTGAAMGSLAYMSPEQVRGDKVDARTDVYSLGVTLYELLTLQEPFFDESSEALRALILRGQPKSIRGLNRRVPWDLETVCLRAMAPEPQQRYASAAAFAADLQNLLDRAPIAARRPGFWLRTRRLVQRRPTASAAVALSALLCTALPTGLWWQQRRANKVIQAALDQAKAEAETTRRTVDFLVGSVRLADPERSLGETMTVRQMVDDAAARCRTELQGQPRVQAALLSALGSVYRNLGLYDESSRLLAAAIPLADEIAGEPAFTVRLELARVQRALGSLPAAEATLRAAAERLPAVSAFGATAELRVERALLAHDRGDRAAAFAELDAVEALCRARAGADATLLDVLRARVRLLVRHGGYQEALTRLPELEALALRVLGPHNAVRAYLLHDRARALRDAGEHEKAVAAFADAAQATEAIFGAEHLNLADVREGWALALANAGQRASARAQLRAAEQIRCTALREEHPAVAHNLTLQGEFALDDGEFAAAVAAYAAAEAIYLEVLPDNQHVLASVAGQRAIAAIRNGDVPGALEHGRRAKRIYDGLPPHEDHAVFLERFAFVLAQAGSLDEARATAARSLELRRKLHAAGHAQIAQALQVTAQVEAVGGSYARALELVDEALAILERQAPPNGGSIGLCRVLRGNVLAGLDRNDEAVASLSLGVETMTQAVGSDNLNLLEVFVNAGLSLEGMGHSPRAQASYRSALHLAKAKLPAAHPMQVMIRRILGRSLSYTGAHAEAVALCEEAVTLAEGAPTPDEAALNEAREALARVRAAASKGRR